MTRVRSRGGSEPSPQSPIRSRRDRELPSHRVDARGRTRLQRVRPERPRRMGRTRVTVAACGVSVPRRRRPDGGARMTRECVGTWPTLLGGRGSLTLHRLVNHIRLLLPQTKRILLVCINPIELTSAKTFLACLIIPPHRSP